MGPRHHLSFCACNTAWLAPELQVSMCPSPHLWFLHAKQRILDQNFKSLWVPALICGFCMQKSAFWIRITSLYGSHISPILLCIQNSVIWTWISSLYGFQPSSVVLCMQNGDFRNRITSLCRWIDPTCGFRMQNSDIWTRIASLYGSQTSPVVLCMQYSVISTRITSLYVSQPSSMVFACKTAHFGPELQVSIGPRPHLWFWAHITASLTQK